MSGYLTAWEFRGHSPIEQVIILSLKNYAAVNWLLSWEV